MIATYKHFGQPIPQGLVSPELHDIEHTLYGAFWELRTECADSGHPINWRSIRDYGKMVGVEPRLFHEIMRRMDEVYLDIQREKREKK